MQVPRVLVLHAAAAGIPGGPATNACMHGAPDALPLRSRQSVRSRPMAIETSREPERTETCATKGCRNAAGWNGSDERNHIRNAWAPFRQARRFERFYRNRGSSSWRTARRTLCDCAFGPSGSRCFNENRYTSRPSFPLKEGVSSRPFSDQGSQRSASSH